MAGLNEKALKHVDASDTASTSSGEDSSVDGGSVSALTLLYTQYVMNDSNEGCTVMWHGLPNKSRVETDLKVTLEALGALKDIEYVYLPLNHWEKPRSSKSKCRNKGYAFLHFTNSAAASAFQAKVADPAFAGMKKPTSTSLAAFQGISKNLREILSSQKKRTYEGSVHLNMDGNLRSVLLGSVHKLMMFHNAMGADTDRI
jgi:hypothetical protein